MSAIFDSHPNWLLPVRLSCTSHSNGCPAVREGPFSHSLPNRSKKPFCGPRLKGTFGLYPRSGTNRILPAVGRPFALSLDLVVQVLAALRLPGGVGSSTVSVVPILPSRSPFVIVAGAAGGLSETGGAVANPSPSFGVWAGPSVLAALVPGPGLRGATGWVGGVTRTAALALLCPAGLTLNSSTLLSSTTRGLATSPGGWLSARCLASSSLTAAGVSGASRGAELVWPPFSAACGAGAPGRPTPRAATPRPPMVAPAIMGSRPPAVQKLAGGFGDDLGQGLLRVCLALRRHVRQGRLLARDVGGCALASVACRIHHAAESAHCETTVSAAAHHTPPMSLPCWNGIDRAWPP